MVSFRVVATQSVWGLRYPRGAWERCVTANHDIALGKMVCRSSSGGVPPMKPSKMGDFFLSKVLKSPIGICASNCYTSKSTILHQWGLSAVRCGPVNILVKTRDLSMPQHTLRDFCIVPTLRVDNAIPRRASFPRSAWATQSPDALRRVITGRRASLRHSHAERGNDTNGNRRNAPPPHFHHHGYL